MKTFKTIFFSGLFLMVSSLGFSQDFGTASTYETGGFIDKDAPVVPELVWGIDLGKQGESALPPGGNQVFISQVGVGNKIDSEISSADALVEMRQNGNDNLIDVDLAAENIRYKVVQNGNGNTHKDLFLSSTENTQIDLLQEGNNHTFERIGSNSIGNSLKFEMIGESQTIIVRNFQ